ncbi:MAG: hypothetical protein IPF52_14570 [Saprospiraceae bacterium]|nr:hypothetical protein [Saprospiraceae bacterium]
MDVWRMYCHHQKIAEKHRLFVNEDQSPRPGANLDGKRMVLQFCHFPVFIPAKTWAVWVTEAVTTDDEEIYKIKDTETWLINMFMKYWCQPDLDEMQAAIPSKTEISG